MRVLHFYKTYLSETVGGIEQVSSSFARAADRGGSTTTS